MGSGVDVLSDHDVIDHVGALFGHDDNVTFLAWGRFWFTSGESNCRCNGTFQEPQNGSGHGLKGVV